MTITATTSYAPPAATYGASFDALLQGNPISEKKAEISRLQDQLKPQGNDSDLSAGQIRTIKDHIATLQKEIEELEHPKPAAPAHNNQAAPVHNNQAAPVHNNQAAPVHNNQGGGCHYGRGGVDPYNG